MMDTYETETEGKQQAAVQKINNEEFAFFGIIIKDGFQNTEVLKDMKYDDAMDTKDKERWEIAVE